MFEPTSTIPTVGHGPTSIIGYAGTIVSYAVGLAFGLVAAIRYLHDGHLDGAAVAIVTTFLGGGTASLGVTALAREKARATKAAEWHGDDIDTDHDTTPTDVPPDVAAAIQITNNTPPEMREAA